MKIEQILAFIEARRRELYDEMRETQEAFGYADESSRRLQCQYETINVLLHDLKEEL